MGYFITSITEFAGEKFFKIGINIWQSDLQNG